MKKPNRRLFVSIIIMQILVFACLFLMRFIMVSYSKNFRDTEIKQYNILVNLESISADVHNHRNLMGKCLSFSSEGIRNENMTEMKTNREEIDILLIESELNFEDLNNPEDMELFGELKDSVKAYFDYSDRILNEYETEKRSLDMALYEKSMAEYTYRINSNINKMEKIAKNNIDSTGMLMESSLAKDEIAYMVGMILLFISTTVTLVFCKMSTGRKSGS